MRAAGSILLAAAATASLFVAAPAEACVFIAPVCIGSRAECRPTPAQRERQDRRNSVEATRHLLFEARARLRAGTVDFAGELADMLVPNIRPVRSHPTSCGDLGEPDPGAGRETEESLFRAITAGTPMAGADPDEYGAIFRDDELSFGAPCNAEFRRGFAAWLRETVHEHLLPPAWLFLTGRRHTAGPYGSLYPRLVRFEGEARSPPVRWTAANRWLREEILDALRREPWGPPILASIEGFWSQRAATLGDDRQVCPAAVDEHARVRARIVAEMTEAARQRAMPMR